MEVEVGDIVEVFGNVGKVTKKDERNTCTIKLDNGNKLVLESWWWGWDSVTVLERGLDEETE